MPTITRGLEKWTASVALIAAPALSQELLWQFASPANSYTLPRPGSFLGDLDHDGVDDLFAFYSSPTSFISIRILSGATGAVINERIPAVQGPNGSVIAWNGVGDFDLDGYPDYVLSWDDQGFNNRNHVQVWSPHLGQELRHVVGPRPIWFGGLVAGRLDLDGDGLPDLAIASTQANAPDVRAYAHSGAPLYTIPFFPLRMQPFALIGLPDLDHDGCNEILVGGTDYNQPYTRGMLAVLSGRTGAFLRVTYDQVQGDIMGFPAALSGDIDCDGVDDYCTGNYLGGSNNRKLVSVYSSVTGAMIRQWVVPLTTGNLATSLVGGRDVDLDGVPDVIAGTGNWPNVNRARSGRVQAFSSRDQQLLAYTLPQVDITAPSYAPDLVDLGVQPGSPYPVVAFTYRPATGIQCRLEVWRLSPPGERHLGVGCASGGLAPTIGVRRVETAQVDQCRLVLGSAPPGAVAMCVAAGASEATFAGSPLPYTFDALGFPGCNLFVPPTLTDVRMVGSAGMDRGYAAIDVPLQLNAVGFGAAVQWLVFDFTTGAFAATPRCEVHLQ